MEKFQILIGVNRFTMYIIFLHSQTMELRMLIETLKENIQVEKKTRRLEML